MSAATPSLIVCVLGVLVSACPRTISVDEGRDAGPRSRRDAHAADGFAADAPAETDSGIDADGGFPDAAEPEPDATAPDTGARDAGPEDAGPPALTFTEMTLPGGTQPINAVFVRSATEAYAGTSNGSLLGYDGASWSSIWREPGNLSVVALWGTPSILAIASETGFHVRASGGTATHNPNQRINDIQGFGPRDIYLAGQDSTGAVLRHFDGRGFSVVVPRPMGVAELTAVYGDSALLLYLGGTNGRLFELRPGTLMVAQIEWPAGWTVNRIAETTFFEIGRAAGELYAVASHHAVFRRGQDEVWRAVYIPEHPDELTSLATFGGEAYAGGRSAPGGGIVRLRGNTWAPIGLDDRYHVFDVTPLGGNTLLAAGMVKNTVSGRILVGRY